MLALALVVVLAAPAAWAEPDDDATEAAAQIAREVEEAEAAALGAVAVAEAALTAADERLRAAQEALEGARSRGRAADGCVRTAEAALPDAVVAVARAELELVAIEQRLEELHAERDLLREELVVAEQVLSQRAVRTFKTGQLSAVAGPVAVLREARDPGELARGLAELRVLTRVGARAVHEVVAAIDDVEEEIAHTRDRRDRQREIIATREGELAGAEELATRVRDAADHAEAAVLAAMDRELTARARLADAVATLAEAAGAATRLDAELPKLAAAALADEDDASPAVADRAKEVAGRRRAHERATRLAAEHRRTATAWVCPVAGASFVNDWAFPRTGDRRHEGTDLFAPRGTDVAAVTGGIVTRTTADRPTRLGGITVSVSSGGDRQYYAHLQAIRPGLAVGDEVAAGDLLGWVGTTGNARGTPPHLHLGWYALDVAVNPYASLVVACADDPGGAAAADRQAAGLLTVEAAARAAGRDQGWRTPAPDTMAR